MPSFLSILSLSTAAGMAAAQTPLTERIFSWGSLPYQADTDSGERGHQAGYNRCNATTQGQTSMCQTAVINSIEDFCLWAPQEPDSIVGNTEGEMVAWCTKEGYGTRIIPEGALTGVQFMKTSEYVQISGRINQSLINIKSDDTGGEMDPHGADRRGNPLGGLVYSQRFTSSNAVDGFTQVIEWHNFMGGNVFCLKACDPNSSRDAEYCQHTLDRIGCAYNAPASYTDKEFTSCEGDLQLPPGVYVENGVTSTYAQPPESLGAISTLPYTPTIPASSSCTTYTSASIYTAAASLASASRASVSATASRSSSASSGGASASASRSGASSPAASASGDASNGAGMVGVSAVAAAMAGLAALVAA